MNVNACRQCDRSSGRNGRARTAQLLNYASLAGDCGISQPCAKAWLGILEACFIAFRLPAFETRTRKRLVKMPKLYFHDTGLACWLLGIREARQLRSHPLRGALFETWVVSEFIKLRANRGGTQGLSFYRDRNGAEADLIIERPAGLTLLDAKSSATPSDGLFSGVRRVRRHFPDTPPHDVAVAYGGEEFQQRRGGRLIPWRMLRAAALPDANPVVRVVAGGRPLADAGILALFADNTWKRAKTGKDGEAALDLHSSHLPLTLFVAARGFAAHLERAWLPAERELHIALSPLRSGGAVLFTEAPGRVPGLAGQLNPVRDPHDSTYLYADRIAINGGRQQPVVFRPGRAIAPRRRFWQGVADPRHRDRRKRRAGGIPATATARRGQIDERRAACRGKTRQNLPNTSSTHSQSWTRTRSSGTAISPVSVASLKCEAIIHRRDQLGRSRRQYAGAERTGHAVKKVKRVQVDDAQRRGDGAPVRFAGSGRARPQDGQGESASKAEAPHGIGPPRP